MRYPFSRSLQERQSRDFTCSWSGESRVHKGMKVVVLLIFSFYVPIFSQTPYFVWSKVCSTGVNNPSIYCSASLGDNGFIIGGSSYIYTNTGRAGYVWLTRVDAAGNILWTKDTNYSYGTAMKLIANKKNQIIVLGRTGLYIRILKVDLLGNRFFDSTYTNLQGFPTDMIESKEGGIYYAVNPEANTNFYPYVAKIDSSGKLLWRTTVDSPNIWFSKIALDIQNDNSIFVEAILSRDKYMAVTLYKLGPDGTTIFGKPSTDSSFNPSQNDIKSTARTANGDFLIATTYLDVAPFMTCLYRIDTLGNLVWRHTYSHIFGFIVETPEKNIVAGSGLGDGMGGTTFTFSMLDSSGNTIRERSLANIFCGPCNIIHRGNSFFGISVRSYSLFKIDFPPFFVKGFHTETREMFEDSILTDTVIANDSTPTDSIRYFISGLPNQITRTGRTCIVRWMPSTDNDSGMHRIAVRIKDNFDQSDSLFYFIHVKAVNDAPVVKSFSFTVLSGPEKDTVKVVSLVYDEENDSIRILWHSSQGDSLSTQAAFSFLKEKSDSIDTISVVLADNRGAVSNPTFILNYNNNTVKTPVKPQIKLEKNKSISFRFKNNVFRLNILTSTALCGSLRIFDIRGHLIKELKISQWTGFSVPIDLRMLSTGIYFFEMLVGGKWQVAKIIAR